MGKPVDDGHHRNRHQWAPTMPTPPIQFTVLISWIGLAVCIGHIWPAGNLANLVHDLLHNLLFSVACRCFPTINPSELKHTCTTACDNSNCVVMRCTEIRRGNLDPLKSWQKLLIAWIALASGLKVATCQVYCAALFICVAMAVAADDWSQITTERTSVIFLAILAATMAINMWKNNGHQKCNVRALFAAVAGALMTGLVLLARSAKRDAEYIAADCCKNDETPWLINFVKLASTVTVFGLATYPMEARPDPRRGVRRVLPCIIFIGRVTASLFFYIRGLCWCGVNVLEASGDVSMAATVMRTLDKRAVPLIICVFNSACLVNCSVANLASISGLLSAGRDDGVAVEDFPEYIEACHKVPIFMCLVCWVLNVCFASSCFGQTVTVIEYMAPLVMVMLHSASYCF